MNFVFYLNYFFCFVFIDKYSISLYFKSWLINNDHENEHLQLYLPTIEKSWLILIDLNMISCFLAEYIDQSWHMIRCDLQEILIDPHHHINHDRFVSFHFYLY